MSYHDYLGDWNDVDQAEFDRVFHGMCQNVDCQHPFCPEDTDIDLWEGINDDDLQ